MSTKPLFVGRKEQLYELELLLNKKSASLVVVQGRRRIGKSRLIREFGNKKNLYIFSGLPINEKTTAQSQREEFARQLTEKFGFPGLKADNWGDLFSIVAKATSKGRVIILLDEISWMGSCDSEFLGHIKNAWDLNFSQNPQLILVLCGSVSAWIDKNILNNTGFMGRISLTIFLKELSIPECNQLLNLLGCRTTPMEKFKILSVTGGVPRYLEEIQHSLNADQNIKRLCFKSSGILFNEFEQMFFDLFSRRAAIYKNIVEILINGHLEFNQICQKLQVDKSGLITEYLNDLIKSGLIRRDFTWNIKNKAESRLSHYRLSDNYLRFYLKCIIQNKKKIENGLFDNRSLATFVGWDSIMGLQFENLVLNNREFIWKNLNVLPEDISSDNPFFKERQ
jgi:uncharacterized protein